MELEQIITLNEKLIYKIATKFYDVPKEDLYQAGVIGLIKAYNNYNKQSDTKFTTYAYNNIFGEMYELANNTRTKRLNKNILKTYKKIEEAKQHLSQKLGYSPSIQEVSTFLSIPETIINEIETCTGTIMSLDVESERPLYETIAAAEPSHENIDLQDSLNTLTEEEKQIINYRYYKDFTQSETARILGMSQVTVSRYEKKSLTKMYNYLNI